MMKSRLTAAATGAALSVMFSGAAFAVGNQAECTANGGDVIDVNGVKSCLIAVIPEEYQGEEYASELKGVNSCAGTLRKTSIGDYCVIALEAKPAAVTPAAAVSEGATAQINTAIGEAADAKAEMAADVVKDEAKKKGGFFSRN